MYIFYVIYCLFIGSVKPIYYLFYIYNIFAGMTSSQLLGRCWTSSTPRWPATCSAAPTWPTTRRDPVPLPRRAVRLPHLHQRFASIKRSLCCSNVLKGNDVAQLTERSLPTPQDQCLIPSIATLCQHLLLISL